ncbi:MAG: ABC transporter ATP-binding protein [Gammaproteobacteria bacterium]|nr:MAG: ABC transporter ATP-binding protein [Gammaproteobacteria bacterium]
MIRLEHICRRFLVGDQVVTGLDDVSLDIHPGEYLSVMGPSGSGKSTLLNILGLLDPPDSGKYFLNDKDTSALSDTELAALRQQSIGFIFQAYHLIPRLTARENIELPLVLGGVPAAERKARSSRVIEQLGLTDRAHHLPNQLSGGQRQRVAIGRAIITEPVLLLADEPTGNLDSHSGQEVMQLLEALHHDGLTLLVVTHDVALGQRAHRRLRMLDGAISEDIRDSNPQGDHAHA